MKPNRIITLTVIALSLLGKTYAQTEFRINDTIQNINFRIIDAQTQDPVGLAHVINITKRVGVISDLLGYLNIPVYFGDSIRISAIGYNNKELLNWGQYKSDTIFYSIKLIPTIYEIKEVKISRFSTYERFLREVINLKIPKNKEELQLDRLHGYFFRIINGMDLKNLPNTTSGISFGKDWYVKQNEKLAEMLEKERDRRIIDRKYNPGIVQNLTGLTGDELYKFIATLGFDDVFIIKSSDYEIREEITKRFKNYKKTFGKKSNQNNQ